MPQFLRVDEVLDIHRDQIDRYGGKSGLRDAGMLLSALATPMSGADRAYFHSDLCEMAAAYLYHIVQNHPFVDGNKRTGLAVAVTFLELNGIDFDSDEAAATELVLAVAQGKCLKPAIADFFRGRAAE